MVVYIEDKKQKELISSTILADLPDWFGLPDSTAEYVRCSKEMPFWAEIENDTAKGFISLKETSSYTAEIYVMGVLKAIHNNGIGKKLFEAFYSYAKEHDYSFIQVKTVQEGHYDEYDKTIQFYKKLGFKEFECFPTLWDEWNPCQIYIMAIK
ncbi:GNAT family N-acetyltransferase [Anaerocolumna aminovalerica]|jgi:GNAT superfamily N-acetyltransferase|uniref:Acetyltransferase (GNAT) domain-containing protein n=1 Tax=Anaerocolumna aminovalerica TaxID=1527 RepID=A0A1I5FN84_9FIRM|nr:GNAT family N-acetyltransferase [Anaerocolumna aminovalerica]MBU5331623.1 GNAT family N-acetyltransferase [Anaerocolumna aminovalerica]MDU6265346.1 GNAT family N-acetyltransferase [Anaerocolumna aminovalerica]SFO25049.1 Acetyltransferase (GNAT) domain-containing protein [Anaerocolumna aminovalerica]